MTTSLAKGPLSFSEALALDDELTNLVDYAQVLADEAQAANTIRAYRIATHAFERWCGEKHLASLPADPRTLAAYLALLERSGKGLSTIRVALAAICSAHRRHNVDPPHPALITRRMMEGIARRLGTTPHQKAAICDDELLTLVGVLGRDLVGLRDKALLLWAFAGAFRRSELVRVKKERLARKNGVLDYLLPRSKRNQQGKFEMKVIAPARREPRLCPVAAFDEWVDAAGIESGYVFRGILNGKVRSGHLSEGWVAKIVKRTALRAGMDVAHVERLAAHSLRAGFVTTADEHGYSMAEITEQTGQTERTARTYIRRSEARKKNAAMTLL